MLNNPIPTDEDARVLVAAIRRIVARLAWGQSKSEIQTELGLSESLFFWAWQAATYEPLDKTHNPLSSNGEKSFRCSCTVTSNYILYA